MALSIHAPRPTVRHLAAAAGLLTCLIAGARPAHAADSAAPTAAERAAPGAPLPDSFMPLSEIRPGMVGIGHTVFNGYEVETFRAEILGVEHNYFAGGDLILARLEGGPLEAHGVAAGMSGSPVFIDGRLIGAVAYGWSFSFKPYCGITPIEQMWTVLENIDTVPHAPSRRAVAGGAPTRPSEAWNWQPGYERYLGILRGDVQPETPLQRTIRPTLPALANEEGGLRPLATPLFLSGASPHTEQMLRRFFASRGMELMGAGSLAGSAGAGREPAPPIEPGSGLGVPLLTGDLALSGIGTATWREGDRIIGFGHPMFHDGSVNLPMAPAYILGIMQSYQSSFKMGEVGEPIGAIVQDRLYGIGGRIGATPARVPIRARVSGSAVALPRTYHFSAWQDADYLPTLALSAMEESFISSVSTGGRLTAEVAYTIRLSDGRELNKRYRASSEALVVAPALNGLLRDLYLLLDNPFAEADIAEIDVAMQIEPGYREDQLLALQTRHEQYLAGETVELTARFRPWRGDDYDRRLQIAIPEGTRPGVYVVHLTDSSGSQRMDQTMHPGRFSPRTFDEVVALAASLNYPADELRLSLVEPAVDLDIRGREFRNLPASVGGVIQATTPARDQQSAVGRLVERHSINVDVPVIGSATVAIRVVEHLDR